MHQEGEARCDRGSSLSLLLPCSLKNTTTLTNVTSTGSSFLKVVNDSQSPIYFYFSVFEFLNSIALEQYTL